MPAVVMEGSHRCRRPPLIEGMKRRNLGPSSGDRRRVERSEHQRAAHEGRGSSRQGIGYEIAWSESCKGRCMSAATTKSEALSLGPKRATFGRITEGETVRRPRQLRRRRQDNRAEQLCN
jgi:hypothetical protein